jgi:serine/threonine-protein kinase HipA
MRTYLAQRADIHPTREFFLLWVLGKDLPGAISIQPADGHAWPSAEDRGGNAADGDDDRRHENALRFSLAGVQLKFSAISEASGGLTVPAKGVGGSWIVKLPSREFEGVAENEFSMMTLASKIGMNVPPIRLIDPASIENLPQGLGILRGQALAIERFDRLQGEEAVHIEDFAQVFRVYPEGKYEKASYRNLARVIGAEGRNADVEEFISRLVFNTLIGNADMHLKNWSLIYLDKRRAALAPAYDFVSTVAYLPDDNAALKFSRTKRFDELTLDELSHLADKALLPQKLVLDAAKKTVALFQEHWAKEKKNLPMPSDVREAIERHIGKVPIAK